MKNKKLSSLLLLFYIIRLSLLLASPVDLESPLPLDDSVLIGKLENGLTYYIRQNSTPLHFAELRLVINAGAAMEDDDQRGIAHLVEHAAFNGTTAFPGDSLRVYQNSIGFGLDGGNLNAMTSIEATTYVLPTRTDLPEQLSTAFFILSEWASALTLDDNAIDKERGIILEEWRMDQNGWSRMFQLDNEILYAHSKYALRTPIGLPEVIEHAPYQRFRDFYRDWYRPDLQAVIAVGDFDIEHIKSLIEKYFNRIPLRPNPRAKEEILLPFHEETLICIGTDPEVTDVFFRIAFKLPAHIIETVGDYRNFLRLNLVNTMFSNRISELTRKPGSPILWGGAIGGQYQLSNMQFNYVSAILDDAHITEGITSLITEIYRIYQHGFYQSELNLAKEILLAEYAKAYLGRSTVSSDEIIERYEDHFISLIPLLSEQFASEIATVLLDDIELTDLSTIIKEIYPETNRAVTLFAPDNIQDQIPSKEDIQQFFYSLNNIELDVYPETMSTESLLTSEPRRTKISKPKYDPKLGVYTWVLKNGAKVHLKQTDFKKNEILFSGFRFGGISQASDELYYSAVTASEIIGESGIGTFNQNILERYLSSKDVSFLADIRPNREMITGSSSIQDFETAMQLLWLTFHPPRLDEEAFQNWKRRTEIQIKNNLNDPENIHQEAILRVLYQGHPRSKGNTFMSMENLQSVELHKAIDFFTSRFNSVNGFEFVVVGDIDKDKLHSYIATYIASLPSQKINTEVVDRNQRLNQIATTEEIYQGSEQCIVRLIFPQDFHYSFQEYYQYQATIEVLSNILNEHIREEMSGVYYIVALPQMDRFPIEQVATQILMYCAPNRVDELVARIHQLISLVQNNTFDDVYLNTFQETAKQRRGNETRTNLYWVDMINEMRYNGFSPEDILALPQLINNLTRTDIVHLVNKYIDIDKQLKIVLYPTIEELDE